MKLRNWDRLISHDAYFNHEDYYITVKLNRYGYNQLHYGMIGIIK